MSPVLAATPTDVSAEETIPAVQGNGQTELVEAITGLRKALEGKVSLLGRDVTNPSPRTLTQLGLAHVPEDRHKHGLILQFPVDLNLILETYYHRPFSNGWWIDLESIRKNAEQLIREFDVRTPSVKTLLSSLSGGNQQKVVVAREMSRPIRLLIINQPTRGLDVGSIEFIHKRIIDITRPTSQRIDALSKLDLPAGVNIEIKV